MQESDGAAIACGALDIAHPRIPVVAALVDEPEARPDRIGEVDARHPSGISRTLPDAVGGKRKRAVGKSLPAPASVGRRLAALRGRIPRVELCLHEPENLRRQSGFERAAGAIHQEDVVPLLDPRRRHGHLRQQAAAGDQQSRKPPTAAPGDLAGDDEHDRHDQQGETRQVIDWQPERCKHQDERREFHPGLAARAVRGPGVQWWCLIFSAGP